MLMFRYSLYFLGAIFLFSSCGTNDESAFDIDVTTIFNQINLEKLNVKQSSKYILFKGVGFGQISGSSLQYTNDTLIVNLTSIQGDVLTFTERITDHSTLLTTGDPFIADADMIKTSVWSIAEDSLKFVSGNSFLFWTNSSQALPLTTAQQISSSVNSWYTNDESISNQKIELGTINGRTYKNLLVANDVNETFVDGNGYQVVYNRPFGIVRTIFFNPLVLDGLGWDLKLGN